MFFFVFFLLDPERAILPCLALPKQQAMMLKSVQSKRTLKQNSDGLVLKNCKSDSTSLLSTKPRWRKRTKKWLKL